MELPKRKPPRLPEYDYASPGAYFVTICTKDRRCILSDITAGAAPCLQLTDTGKIVEQYILSTERMTGFHVDNYVIMPNHIHMILRIDNGPPPPAARHRGSALCPECGMDSVRRKKMMERRSMSLHHLFHFLPFRHSNVGWNAGIIESL